jgi:hypothetical protein
MSGSVPTVAALERQPAGRGPYPAQGVARAPCPQVVTVNAGDDLGEEPHARKYSTSFADFSTVRIDCLAPWDHDPQDWHCIRSVMNALDRA